MNGAIEVLTVGHSTHPIDDFIALIKTHHVSAVADVRSQPFSRFASQFNKNELAASLKQEGIRYVFLGRELGAHAEDPSCYVDGRVQYDRLAETEAFREGLARVQSGAQQERIALMCTEKDPLDCHRTVLVADRLTKVGAHVAHILADGSVESHSDAMDRLMRQRGMQPSLFQSRDEQLTEALAEQEAQIAYVDEDLAAMSRTEAS